MRGNEIKPEELESMKKETPRHKVNAIVKRKKSGGPPYGLAEYREASVFSFVVFLVNLTMKASLTSSLYIWTSKHSGWRNRTSLFKRKIQY